MNFLRYTNAILVSTFFVLDYTFWLDSTLKTDPTLTLTPALTLTALPKYISFDVKFHKFLDQCSHIPILHATELQHAS